MTEDFAPHRDALRALLTRLLGDSALAEDLAQEALLRAGRAAATRRGEATARTWLFAIALNLARSHFRAAKRAPRLAELDAADSVAAPDDPERDVLQAEMSGCILGHIERLKPAQKDAVLLHHFSGLSHAEIAATLGTSEGNARVLLHRGLAALRASLGTECVLDFGDAVPCERR